MNSRCFDQERLEHPVSVADPTIAPQSSHCICHCHSGSSTLIDGRFECFLTEKQPYRWNGKEYTKQSRSRVTRTIDMLPDLALLEIFDFYVGNTYKRQAWHTLVHVCRKWRDVAFGSPRRLNLRLVCGIRTPARETLDIWPLFPIIISACSFPTTWDVGNLIAALEHNDRICRMSIDDVQSSGMAKVLAALQQPFPALTGLFLESRTESAPVVSASFLGGSAPGLQTLHFRNIPFPGLPKLLSTATHLVNLELYRIPHSGYFSPEAMVTALSVLTRLEHLVIHFKSPQSSPDQNSRCHPPQARNLLPVLTHFTFDGVSEYLEVLMAWIDAPLLDKLMINFSYQLIFDTPQLTRFIIRTPMSKAHSDSKAHVEFYDWVVMVTLLNEAFTLGILCNETDLQLSSLAQVCSLSFPSTLILAVEHLYILSLQWEPRWQDDIENDQWLELFLPFTAVRCLYIDSKFKPQVAYALQELGERVADVLPALENLFFLEEPLPSEPVQEAIGQFVATRQLAGQTIAISRWKLGEEESEEEESEEEDDEEEESEEEDDEEDESEEEEDEIDDD